MLYALTMRQRHGAPQRVAALLLVSSACCSCWRAALSATPMPEPVVRV
eukprot:COSAG01_NODE_71217_length_256_cov_1.292994_2_plen_47_part_01